MFVSSSYLTCQDGTHDLQVPVCPLLLPRCARQLLLRPPHPRPEREHLLQHRPARQGEDQDDDDDDDDVQMSRHIDKFSAVGEHSDKGLIEGEVVRAEFFHSRIVKLSSCKVTGKSSKL